MATRKILFRGQTRRKGEKTSISGKPLPGIWVTGGIFPQNKGYERAIIYTQDPKVEKHVVYAETVGQYTGVDDVLETPVFEDDIITFWQRTDTKHLQRYKGIVKYDEALTSAVGRMSRVEPTRNCPACKGRNQKTLVCQ